MKMLLVGRLKILVLSLAVILPSACIIVDGDDQNDCVVDGSCAGFIGARWDLKAVSYSSSPETRVFSPVACNPGESVAIRVYEAGSSIELSAFVFDCVDGPTGATTNSIPLGDYDVFATLLDSANNVVSQSLVEQVSLTIANGIVDVTAFELLTNAVYVARGWNFTNGGVPADCTSVQTLGSTAAGIGMDGTNSSALTLDWGDSFIDCATSGAGALGISNPVVIGPTYNIATGVIDANRQSLMGSASTCGQVGNNPCTIVDSAVVTSIQPGSTIELGTIVFEAQDFVEQ